MTRRAADTGRAFWADYRAQYVDWDEGPARAALLLAPRLAVDPSLHATVLIRAVGTAPRPLRGAVQRCLLWAHATYVDATAEIGPGLVMRHPTAIVLGPGVRIGRGVSLFHNVTVRAGAGGAPHVDDGARLSAGAVVVGPVHVGRDAMIGAGAVVDADVPDGGRLTRRHGAADGDDPVLAWQDERGGDRVPAPGFRGAVRADHAARFGPRAPGRWALIGRALSDRAFRVAVVVRLMHHGPRPLWRLWRRVLLSHGCDIGLDASIGAGVAIPHPVGVVVGRRTAVGAGVELQEHTTVTSTRTSWEAAPVGQGMAVGDHVRVLPGAAAFGDVTIAAGAVIAGGAIVTRDVAPDDDALRSSAMRRPAAWLPDAAAGPGLAALVRSDLARLTGGRVRRPALLGVPFQAAVLVRLATGRSTGLARVGRLGLRALHHCYVARDVQIGPGLCLPLPCGIRMDAGVRLGAGVTVGDRVSLCAGTAAGRHGRAPWIADGTVLGSGVVALGAQVVSGTVPEGAALMPTGDQGLHQTAS